MKQYVAFSCRRCRRSMMASSFLLISVMLGSCGNKGDLFLEVREDTAKQLEEVERTLEELEQGDQIEGDSDAPVDHGDSAAPTSASEGATGDENDDDDTGNKKDKATTRS